MDRSTETALIHGLAWILAGISLWFHTRVFSSTSIILKLHGNWKCFDISTNHTETPSLTHEDRYNSINIKVDSSFQNTAACIHKDSIKVSSDCLADPTTYVWYISTGNIWNTQHTRMPEEQNHWLRKEQGIWMPSLLHKVTKGQMWLRHWT
jgi:hypothetical protein